MKKTKFYIIFSISILFILPLTARAFAVKADNSVYIGQDEVVAGNLYAAGANIIVDGTVKGDVICAGQTININGQVEGDVICAGQTININGQVGGSIRAAGNSINVNSAVARNVQAFGASIILGKDAVVGWDMLIAGATGEIRGQVGGDLHGAAANIIIAGKVGRDVKLKVDENVKREKKGISQPEKASLIINKEAVIGGQVVYTSGKEALIDEGAAITGEVTRKLPKAKDFKKKGFVGWAWGRLYSIFSALVIGLVLISLWRKQIIELTGKMLDKVGAAIGWGAIIMFLTPIIAILLMITLIGLPLAFILLGVWLIAILLSKIIVGILIGRSLIDKFWHKKKDSLIWAMIIGIIIFYLILSLPIIGWLITLVAIWWGLGGIWFYCKQK